MADNTHIEWTDATWNPITGCAIVSPGCTNCYAMRLAGTRLAHHESRAGLTRDTKAGPVWTGEVRLNAQWLDQPLRWAKPRMVFVCAHGDLFAENVPDEWIDKVFAVMALAPQHTFQVLTKRAARMREYLSRNDVALLNRWATAFPPGTFRLSQHQTEAHLSPFASPQHRALYDATQVHAPLPNVWLGVSVEDQKRANERIPDLLATPAAVRWISAEPLLGPVNLVEMKLVEWWHEGGDATTLNALRGWKDTAGRGVARENLARLDWVICGGESGPGARPMHPDWARSLRDQCAAGGVPFFFKQWGAWAACRENDGEWPVDAPRLKRILPSGVTASDGWPMQHVGKTRAGRLLDGVEHNAFPQARR